MHLSKVQTNRVVNKWMMHMEVKAKIMVWWTLTIFLSAKMCNGWSAAVNWIAPCQPHQDSSLLFRVQPLLLKVKSSKLMPSVSWVMNRRELSWRYKMLPTQIQTIMDKVFILEVRQMESKTYVTASCILAAKRVSKTIKPILTRKQPQL